MDVRFDSLLDNFFDYIHKWSEQLDFKKHFMDFHIDLFKDICGENLSDNIEFFHRYPEFNSDSEWYEYPNIIYHAEPASEVYYYQDIFKLLDKLLGCKYQYPAELPS